MTYLFLHDSGFLLQAIKPEMMIVSFMNNGSPLWQLIFISFATVLVLFEMVRGWRLGLVRQLVRLTALVCGYVAAIYGGRILLPFLRTFIEIPDVIISVGAGAIMGLLVYVVITGAGAILFRRTSEQRVGLVRWAYGICGALLGLAFGLFTVWLVVVGIRSTGAIANAELQSEAARKAPAAHLHPSTSAPALVNSLAKLKNSIELGSLGEVVKATDVVSPQTYQTLGKVSTVLSNPESAGRFLSYPGARELAENPALIALRDDPQVMELIQQQRYLDLLHHPRVIAVMNDPTLAAQIRSFQFQKALDYALKGQP